MKTSEPNELLFSRKPRISLRDVRGWVAKLSQGDDSAKEDLIKFVDHRLRGRYITPLSKVAAGFESGFLMMASSCLLIESLQTFREGKNESDKGSEATFGRFFEDHKECFPGLRVCFPFVPQKNGKGEMVDRCTFYKHIRCGILHQAETTGRYSVVRDESPLFDAGERTVNAVKFFECVVKCLGRYIDDLRAESITSELWKFAAVKVECICDNFEYGKVRRARKVK